jgi:glutathione S-transferase
MITVHHLNASRSMRVLWLLEELGLEYAMVNYQRGPTMRAPAELKAIHPLGKSPVVAIGSEVIAESAVILETLLDRYGNGRLRPPVGTPEYERYRYWLHYAEGSLMPNLLLDLVFTKLPTGMPWLLRPLMKTVMGKARAVVVAPQLETHFGYVESELEKSEWFAGNVLTAADIQMSYAIWARMSRGTVGPKTAAWFARCKERPAYQRALAKAKE